MRSLTCMIAGLGACLLASPAFAFPPASHPGTLCVTVPSTAFAGYTAQWGIHNPSSTSSLSVFCPGPNYSWVFGPSLANISMTVYDRTKQADDLCCSARVLATDGGILQSHRVCAEGFGSPPRELKPVLNAIGTLAFECTIPKNDPENGLSHIASYSYEPGDNGAGNAAIATSALMCAPKTKEDQENIKYSRWGVQNLSSANAVNVACPGIQLHGTYIQLVGLSVYDRTPTANDLCCTARITNSAGTPQVTASGCAQNSGSDVQDIPLSLAGHGKLAIDCTIPPRHANGYSHVTSYQYVNSN